MKEWQFYDMQQNTGSQWTAGSLYTVFFGIPSIFSGDRSEYLKGSQTSKLISLGDILNQLGYETYHISTNADFAGTKDILKTFGIKNILDGNVLQEKYPDQCGWGLFDKDIFNEAKHLLQTRDKRIPFMIFISTIQTHASDGIIDKRMLPFIKKQKTDLETAATAEDWLIEDFLSFLKSENLLQNTVVFLFPDHLFMGEKEIFDKTKESRRLWFMTNADKKDINIDTANFYQIDILPNILSGAKIKTNAVFLSQIINKENKEEYISKNIKKLGILNTTSLEREKTISAGFCITLKDKHLLFLSNKNILFEKTTENLKDSCIILTLSKELKIIENYTMTEDSLKNKFFNCDTYIKISIKNSTICFEWKNEILNFSKYVVSNKHEIKLNPNEIIDIINKISLNLEQGKIIPNNKCPKTNYVLNYLSTILKDSTKIICISAYDDASVYFGKILPILKKVGLRESLEGKFRWAYIAAFSNQKIYCDKATYTPLKECFFVDTTQIFLTSSGLDFRANSNILINHKEYSLKRRGLNFVIFDTIKKQAVDAFNVDFFGDEKLHITRWFYQ